jgi:acetyl-CoA acetyltransferase
MDSVVIAGVGIHPFGRFEYTYREIGAVAVSAALAESGIAAKELDVALVGNVGAEMAKGQNVLELIGRPGMPVINVEAACASSAGTLWLGARLIESGQASIVLCAGVEKAPRGFIAGAGFEQWQIAAGIGVNPVYFALQAQELVETAGVTSDDLADVSVKNHLHAVENPNAMYRKAVSREEVLASPLVCPPLNLLMLCTPNEGAAAVVLMRREVARSRGVAETVDVRSVSVVSRSADDWFVPAPSFQVGKRSSITARAAAIAYAEAGIGPEDVDVVECQDTDAGSELLAYRELGFCEQGEEVKLLRDGTTRLGGSLPFNPSGGLLSKGEPLGASGLGQVHELVQQLRGRCGSRQVVGATVGIGQVMGAGHNASLVLLAR